MAEKPKHIEFVEEKEAEKAPESTILRGIMDGSLLTRKAVTSQLPFLFFLAFMSIIYISNRYHADMLNRRIDTLRSETRELRSEAIFVSSELMKRSRQTEVADEVEKRGLGLKESVEPPKKIVVNKSIE
jgi:hypothetical protein